MEQFNNDDLEYVVDYDYYYMAGYDDEEYPLAENEPQMNNDFDSPDSDFEDDFETVNLYLCFLFRLK